MGLDVWELCVVAGVPSAVMGFAVWLLKKSLDKKELQREEKEKTRAKVEYSLVESVRAAIGLGEATANAVARIPDAHCNGDMHAALEYATEVKRRQKALLTQIGIEALNDN